MSVCAVGSCSSRSVECPTTSTDVGLASEIEGEIEIDRHRRPDVDITLQRPEAVDGNREMVRVGCEVPEDEPAVGSARDLASESGHGITQRHDHADHRRTGGILHHTLHCPGSAQSLCHQMRRNKHASCNQNGGAPYALPRRTMCTRANGSSHALHNSDVAKERPSGTQRMVFSARWLAASGRQAVLGTRLRCSSTLDRPVVPPRQPLIALPFPLARPIRYAGGRWAPTAF